jgi:hypothetical protein
LISFIPPFIHQEIKMTKRQAHADEPPKPASAPRAARARSGKHDPSVIKPLPLYSVFLLGAFAMRSGPARGGK